MPVIHGTVRKPRWQSVLHFVSWWLRDQPASAQWCGAGKMVGDILSQQHCQVGTAQIMWVAFPGCNKAHVLKWITSELLLFHLYTVRASGKHSYKRFLQKDGNSWYQQRVFWTEKHLHIYGQCAPSLPSTASKQEYGRTALKQALDIALDLFPSRMDTMVLIIS